jgi:hypothetical protein
MIIKSMSRKTASFGQLLAYLNKPDRKGDALTHNLTSDGEDLGAVLGEFLANARLLPSRRKGNMLFHEVLSFAPADSPALGAGLIEDLTRRYLELRAPRALAYARAHFDAECPHVHIMISANNVASSRRLRVARSRFARIKRELERYQLERYPQLRHSVAHRDQGKARPTSRKEDERWRRHRKQGTSWPSRKEILKAQVSTLLKESWSEADFVMRLGGIGQALYFRGGQAGVIDTETGRRYRLKTLGVDGEFSARRERWTRFSERLAQISAADLEQTRRGWIALGFREEAAILLGEPQQEDGLSDGERERLIGVRRAGATRRASLSAKRSGPSLGRHS